MGECRNVPVRTNLFNLAVLLVNICKASEDPEIGWEDAMYTIDETIRFLNRRLTMLPERTTTSCLWACNLLNEKGDFWHPQGLSFDTFIYRLLGDAYDFDKELNSMGEYKGRGKEWEHYKFRDKESQKDD